MKEVLSLFTFGIGALLLRSVLYRLQAEFRHCSRWDEQARVLQQRKLRLRTGAHCTSLPQYQGLTSGSDSEHRAAAYAANGRFAPRAVIPASGLFTQVTDWLLAGPESIGCATRKR